MKKYFLLILTLAWGYSVDGQSSLRHYSSQSTGLGYQTTQFSDVFSVWQNPAQLANTKSFEAGVFAENRFFLNELNQFGLALSKPTKSGTFGIGALYYGTEQFYQSRIAVAYGRSILEKLQIGIDLDYWHLFIQDYGKKSAVSFGIGWHYQIIPKFSLSGYLYNPLLAGWTESDSDQIPAMLRIGLSYLPSEKVGLYMELDQELQDDLGARFGIAYQVLNRLDLRVGYAVNPAQFHFGIGIILKKINIDISNVYHPVLGLSPQISMRYVHQKP